MSAHMGHQDCPHRGNGYRLWVYWFTFHKVDDNDLDEVDDDNGSGNFEENVDG